MSLSLLFGLLTTPICRQLKAMQRRCIFLYFISYEVLIFLIKLVIFDIGGVLIDFREDQYVHYLHEKVLPEVSEIDLYRFINPLIALMELGLLNVTELENMVGKHFVKKKIRLHWVEGYRKLAKPMYESVKLANRVAKKKNTALLSNVSYSRWNEMGEILDDMLHIKKAFLSFALEIRKPEPAIYRLVLKEMKVKPKEALFIDNQIENVIGAEKAGLNAIWFRNAKQLEKELKDFDVI